MRSHARSPNGAAGGGTPHTHTHKHARARYRAFHAHRRFASRAALAVAVYLEWYKNMYGALDGGTSALDVPHRLPSVPPPPQLGGFDLVEQ